MNEHENQSSFSDQHSEQVLNPAESLGDVELGTAALQSTYDNSLRPGEESYETDVTKAETIAHAVDRAVDPSAIYPEGVTDDRRLVSYRLDDGRVEQYHRSSIDQDEKERLVKREMKYQTSRFEALYAVNPDVFASLPTAEFMEKAEEFGKKRDMVEIREGLKGDFELTAQVLNDIIPIAYGKKDADTRYKIKADRLKRKISQHFVGDGRFDSDIGLLNVMTPEDATAFWQSIENILEIGQHQGRLKLVRQNSTKERILELAEQGRRDYYDQTPRQHVDRFTEFIEGLKDSNAKHLETAKQELDEFTAQFSSQPEEQAENSFEEQSN